MRRSQSENHMRESNQVIFEESLLPNKPKEEAHQLTGAKKKKPPHIEAPSFNEENYDNDNLENTPPSIH